LFGTGQNCLDLPDPVTRSRELQRPTGLLFLLCNLRWREQYRMRPYDAEKTASRPICKVNQRTAQSVVWSGTTCEYCGAAFLFTVPSTFVLLLFLLLLREVTRRMTEAFVGLPVRATLATEVDYHVKMAIVLALLVSTKVITIILGSRFQAEEIINSATIKNALITRVKTYAGKSVFLWQACFDSQKRTGHERRRTVPEEYQNQNQAAR
jgi:hypothetical protein